jgi:type IX secretion system PorP/SprF family membrane protein
MIKKQFILIPVVVFVTLPDISAQETIYGPGYQTVMMTNPAFSGSEGNGILRLSYLNFYPGRNYNLHSFFVSYDSFFPLLHGGAGFFVSNDYSGGVFNDIRGGFNYSYHLQASDKIFINAGLGASFFHRGLSIGNMVFPDQIDPLRGSVLPTSESMDITGKTVIDIGAGFLFIAGKYMAGLSVSHLAQPDISIYGSTGERLDRKLTLHLSASFFDEGKGNLLLRPMMFGEVQGNDFLAGAGAEFVSGFLALNTMILINKAEDLDLQTGISLNFSRFFIFYSYSFNLISGNSLLPASLLHHAGMGISLNDVEKRKTIKTINFPKL